MELDIKQNQTVSDTKAEPGRVFIYPGLLNLMHILLGIRTERSLMCLNLCSFDNLVLYLYKSSLLHMKLVRMQGATGSGQ